MVTILKFIFLTMHLWLQSGDDYSYQKLSRDCIVAYHEDVAVDTLCVYLGGRRMVDRHQILEEVGGYIYRVERIVPGTASFAYTYFSVEKWSLKNDKFQLESSLKIPLGNCYGKKLRIQLKDDGVKWKYNMGLLKKRKAGLIPYPKIKELEEYHLPCE